MSTKFSDWTLDGVRNPLQLQAMILDKFEESTDGKFTMADGNNVATFLMEGFSTIASSAIKKIDDAVLPAIYPNRATTVTDLYKHLSDYEYVHLFASPASCQIKLILERGYILRHAIPVTDEAGNVLYSKIMIPKTARFRIGQYAFGLYYPIEIRVSPLSGHITVLYDTTEVNPMHILNQNVLEHSVRVNGNMYLLYITIPVYQFDVSTTEYPLVRGAGYRKSIPYTDQFYAIRCFADVRDPESNEWSYKELHLALNGRTYNPEEPTVVFTVDVKNKQCIAEIPYVYFTNDLLRGNLKIEIYTTAGYLNYTIPTGTDELVGLDFFSRDIDDKVAKYAEPFRTMPTDPRAIPVSMIVNGGTNGMTYEQIRKRVITNAFGIDTLQTPADVDAYFENLGYITSLYQDGITDRIFIAHSTLRDEDNAIIASAAVNTLFTDENLKQNGPNQRTIVEVEADKYVVLPATVYRLDTASGICRPISDDEKASIDAMTASNRVEYYNNNALTISPFHLQIIKADKYSSTATFDLSDVEIESREFITARDAWSNSNAALGVEGKPYAMSLASAVIEAAPVTPDYSHSSKSSVVTTDKYTLTLRVIKTGFDGFDAGLNNNNYKILFGVKKSSGGYAWAAAKYARTEVDENVDVFVLDISAMAAFNQTDSGYTIRFAAPFTDGNSTVDTLLTSECRVVLCANQNIVDNVDEKLIRYLETDFTDASIPGVTDLNEFIGLTEQRLVVRFGKVVNELDQRAHFSFDGVKYKTYDTTLLSTLKFPVLELEDGLPKVSYVDGVLRASALYSIGDLALLAKEAESSDITVYSYYTRSNHAGCNILDVNTGNPVGISIKDTDTEPTTNPELTGPSNRRAARGSGQDGFEGATVKLSGDHLVPRFTIPLAQTNPSAINSYNPITTYDYYNYELANVSNRRVGADPALGSKDKSMFSDKWYYCRRGDNNAISSSNSTVVEVMVCEATSALDALIKVISPYGVSEPTDNIISYSKNWTSTVGNQVSGMLFLVKGVPRDKVVEYVNVPHLYSNPDDNITTLAPEGNTGAPSEFYTMFPDYKYTPDTTRQFVAGTTYFEKDNSNNYQDAGVTNETLYDEKIRNGIQLYTREGYPLDVIYYYTGTQWVPLFICGVYSEFYNKLSSREGSHAFGMAYVIRRAEPENALSFTGGDKYYKKLDAMLPYIAFMTIDDGTGVPDLSFVSNPNTAWQNSVNKWPWEVTNWMYSRNAASNVVDRSQRILTRDLLFKATPDKSIIAYAEHVAGDTIINEENGEPEPEDGSEGEVKYNINMIQLDAKLANTTEATSTRSYPSQLVRIMRTHFNNLGSARPKLYTSTKLYFEPMKSLGYDYFYTDGDTTKLLPLDVKMGFKLHVSSDIVEDPSLSDSLRQSVIELIDDAMEVGTTSMVDIADKIKSTNSDSVRYVDVLGINGDPNLQTMRAVSSEVKPHLRHKLVLGTDGVTITADRDLDLEFVVADS